MLPTRLLLGFCLGIHQLFQAPVMVVLELLERITRGGEPHLVAPAVEATRLAVDPITSTRTKGPGEADRTRRRAIVCRIGNLA